MPSASSTGWQSSKAPKSKYTPSSSPKPSSDAKVPPATSIGVPPAPLPTQILPTTSPAINPSTTTMRTVLLYMYVPAAADSGSPKRRRCPSSTTLPHPTNHGADTASGSGRSCSVVSGDALYRPSAFTPPEGLGVVQLQRTGSFFDKGPSDPQIAVVLKVPGPKPSDAPAIDFKSTELVDVSIESLKEGYVEGAFPTPTNLWPVIRDDPFAFDLVHVYSVVRHTLDMVLGDLGIPSDNWRWNWDLPPPTSSTTPTPYEGVSSSSQSTTSRPLQILAHAGEKINAVYHRGRRVLKFYYVKGTATSTRRTTYLCRYFDIVSHEAGHAILDSLKPKLYSIKGGQQGALHEAVADLTAIFAQLDIPVMCARVLSETNGDLRRSSSITAIGSRFESSTSSTTPAGTGSRVVGDDGEVEEVLGVRNAINNAIGSTCGSNPYTMANVFSGFVWDVLIIVYEGDAVEVDEDGGRRLPSDRLHMAAAAVRRVLFKGIASHCGPTPSFEDISNAMIAACRVEGGIVFSAMASTIQRCADQRELDVAGLAKKARRDLIHRLMGDY